MLSYPMQYADKVLDLSLPRVMGILNVTPDSFSDGGLFISRDMALKHARQMVDDGADIIDIGGESTRPGAPVVSLQEELDRILPVIEAIKTEIDIPISIDTYKPEIMRAAAGLGVDMINDIKALQEENALATVANLQLPVCIMHMQNNPGTMQQAPHYQDVVAEVKTFLKSRMEACLAAGIAKDKIIIDPGIGYGKTVAHNLQLIQGLVDFQDLQVPILIGLSRKWFIGIILDKPVNERLYGGIALTVLAVQRGARLIRTHDVAATVQALKALRAAEEIV